MNREKMIEIVRKLRDHAKYPINSQEGVEVDSLIESIEDMTVRLELSVEGGLAEYKISSTLDINIMLDQVDYDEEVADVNTYRAEAEHIQTLVGYQNVFRENQLRNEYLEE